MTDLLYLPANEYQKEFDAEVTKVREEDGYICLDRTLFYKEGGGQPADHGEISWKDGEGGKAHVVDVQKEHGQVRHYVEGDLPEPDQEVHGVLDWERRYKHMKMHTAQHIVSKVVLDLYGATTAGNQIHEDYSRIDFKPVEFTDEDVAKIEKAANALIAENHSVEKEFMPRDEAEELTEEGRTNLNLIPESVDPLRMVRIDQEDICPCGGTHVDALGEIGEINITDRVSKGAEVERLEFELV